MQIPFMMNEIINERYRVRDFISPENKDFIYTAKDLFLNRLISLKVNTSKKYFDSFFHEAEILAELEHPHILPIYDVVNFGDITFQIRKYLGENPQILLNYIGEDETLKLNGSLQLLQRVGSSIDYIHSHGYTHHQIRWDTIWIDENGFPYLTNFGQSTQDLENASEDALSFAKIMFYVLTRKNPTSIDFNIVSLRDYRPSLPIGFDIAFTKLLELAPDGTITISEIIDDFYKAFYSGQSNIEGKIFISYARKDSEYVHKLADELRRIGLDLWIDRDIEPGSNWDEAIENGLNDCDMMLLITTEASMSSEYVTHEWSYFMGGGKPVYPFIPQTPIPNNVHPRLSRVQHVVGTDDTLNNVARIVDVLAGGTPTKLGSSDT